MFERFTDEARRVLVLAQEESRVLGHDFIGTEHLLLGILRHGQGPAPEALTTMGVTLEAARAQIAQTVGPRGHGRRRLDPLHPASQEDTRTGASGSPSARARPHPDRAPPPRRHR